MAGYLLAQRPAHKHQGGKWEFPGGKVESGETPLQGLSRELHEELGIQRSASSTRLSRFATFIPNERSCWMCGKSPPLQR